MKTPGRRAALREYKDFQEVKKTISLGREKGSVQDLWREKTDQGVKRN